MVGTTNADGGRGSDNIVPGAIGAGNPAADDTQGTGDQTYRETVGRLVFGSETHGDKLGARANGDKPGVLGFKDRFGQGGGTNAIADVNQVALFQFSLAAGSIARRGCNHLTADARNGCKSSRGFRGCGDGLELCCSSRITRQRTAHEKAEKTQAACYCATARANK